MKIGKFKFLVLTNKNSTEWKRGLQLKDEIYLQRMK